MPGSAPVNSRGFFSLKPYSGVSWVTPRSRVWDRQFADRRGSDAASDCGRDVSGIRTGCEFGSLPSDHPIDTAISLRVVYVGLTGGVGLCGWRGL